MRHVDERDVGLGERRYRTSPTTPTISRRTVSVRQARTRLPTAEASPNISSANRLETIITGVTPASSRSSKVRPSINRIPMVAK